MANSEKAVPAYIPWETFTTFLGHLKATAVPSRIDKSVMPTGMPGLTRGQIQSTLKFLRLIDDAGTTTKDLKDLVAAYETDKWNKVLAESSIWQAYSAIIGDVDLDNATQSQLDERFKAIGVTGQMLVKSVRFYLAALTAAQLTFSPHLMAKRKSAIPPRKRQPAPKTDPKQTQSEATPASASNASKGGPAAPQLPDGMISFPVFIKGKTTGSVNVPVDITPDECSMLKLALQMVEAYAGQKNAPA